MTLKEKIIKKQATIGLIGLGYVGLPLSIRFTEEGYKVFGFDVDSDKIQNLNESKSYINHIDKETIKKLISNEFIATSNFEKIKNVDVIIICVPTPLGQHNEPDLSYVSQTLLSIKDYLSEDCLLILESTTYPGTTEEIIIPLIKDCGFEPGKNFFIGYSPEREDPGNKKYSTKTIPKVVSGFSSECLDLVNLLYSTIVESTVPVSSLKVAEMTKILENIHRAVNIGLVNELKMVADRLDIDIYEVINAASTKPFGFTPYFPGPGLGGHCIPIDPFYLTWKAKEVGMNTRFIELAGEVNTSMPQFVINKIVYALNLKSKPVNGSKILILGLSYKKNVDDLRESPALEILNQLIALGAKVSYCDPYFEEIPKTRKYKLKLRSQKMTPETFESSDIVVLTTDHDDFDYQMIQDKSKLIIDTRGRFKSSEKVIKA
tara:strand:- start:526 stop:1821 length:1296 start_codon:yes stop_codon:yes gene_type:complete